jgi:hypothetical protein
MSIHPFFNRYCYLKEVVGILSIIFVFFFSGCGSGDIEETGQTGSLAFNVKWEPAGVATNNEDSDSNAATPAELDCESTDIAWVKAVVYNRYDELLAESPRWDCADHAGTIQGVKKGLDRWVIIYGMDEDLNLLYRGQESEVEVIENEITEVGLIVAYYFIPTGGTYNSSTERLTWLPVHKATSYEVQVATDDSFDLLAANMTVEEPMSNPLTIPDDHYYARVRAIDYYENQSAWSQVWEFDK